MNSFLFNSIYNGELSVKCNTHVGSLKKLTLCYILLERDLRNFFKTYESNFGSYDSINSNDYLQLMKVFLQKKYEKYANLHILFYTCINEITFIIDRFENPRKSLYEEIVKVKYNSYISNIEKQLQDLLSEKSFWLVNNLILKMINYLIILTKKYLFIILN